MKILTLLFLIILITLSFGQKFFIPVIINQSNGKPLNAANIDLYTSGTATKKYDLTYLTGSGGWYYHTAAIDSGTYDIWKNGVKWRTGLAFSNESLNAAINKTVDGDATVTASARATFLDSVGLDSTVHYLTHGRFPLQWWGQISTTDGAANRDLVQSAIDSIRAWRSGTLLLPNEIILLNKSAVADFNHAIELKDGVILEGAMGNSSGNNGTVFKLADTQNQWMFGTTGSVVEDTAAGGLGSGSDVYVHGGGFRNIRLDLNAANNTTFVGGINCVLSGEEYIWENIHIVGADTAFRNKNSAPLEVENMSIFNTGNTNGSQVGVYNDAGGVAVYQNLSGDDHNLYYHKAGRVVLIAPKMEGDAGAATDPFILVNTANDQSSLTIIGGSVNGTDGVGIKIQAASTISTVIALGFQTSGIDYHYLNAVNTDTVTAQQSGSIIMLAPGHNRFDFSPVLDNGQYMKWMEADNAANTQVLGLIGGNIVRILAPGNINLRPDDVSVETVSIDKDIVTIGAGLDLTSTTNALRLPVMTTTQRDATTPANGDIIYNSTTNKIEGYENGSWVDI